MTKCEQLVSDKGNSIANQFLIYANNGVYFQSYKSIIVHKHKNGKTYLDEYYWDYSKTTSKYRNQFLCETTKQTQQKIDNGTYKLKNLNK